MKLKIAGMLVAATAGAAYFGACSVPQPNAGCPRASDRSAAYVFHYTLQSGTGECADLVVDEVGIEKYNPPGTDDYTVAIQTAELGVLDSVQTDPNSANKPYAIGKLSAFPNDDGFCTVEPASTLKDYELKPAGELEDGGVDPEDPEAPALKVGYAWSNMKILALPSVPGTVVSSDLTYTRNSDSCTYKAVGLWPAISCRAHNDNGSPASDANGDPVFDDAACNPLPDPEAGHPLGSGINPSFSVRCNHTSEYCELTKTVEEIAAELR